MKTKQTINQNNRTNLGDKTGPLSTDDIKYAIGLKNSGSMIEYKDNKDSIIG